MTEQEAREAAEPLPKKGECPHVRVLAHLGDAVWGLLVAEAAVEQLGANPTAKALHRFTVERCRAEFQAVLLEQWQSELDEKTEGLIRQGRNLPLSKGKQNKQALHRQATAFEVLIGHWWLTDKVKVLAVAEAALAKA